MADAPKPAGGGGWETTEIIIAIILVLGVINAVGANKNPTAAPQAAVSTTTTVTPESGSTCGLSITSPLDDAKITKNISLAGENHGCDWPVTDGVSLYAQVIDSTSKPVSAYVRVLANTTVESTGLSEGYSTFATTISLTSKPKKGTGYLILISTKNADNHTVTRRIPLTF